MYPAHFFALFPPFPRNNRVFVAMSFDRRFDQRWAEVIAPGIREVRPDGDRLEPNRVDTSKISDSILTQLQMGIARDLLVLVDVTSTGRQDDTPIRNGNVMYELGLAHAVRLPEEVILFRSDNDRLLFDVANVRVNHYEPEVDATSAKHKVVEAITEAIREIDLQKHLAVEKALASLDAGGYLLLTKLKGDVLDLPKTAPGQLDPVWNSVVSRLLDLGILSTERNAARGAGKVELTLKYQLTEFGRVIRSKMVT